MTQQPEPPVAIPAGAFFYVSSGEYEQYGVMGLFRAVKDVPATELLEKYVGEREWKRDDHFNFSEFLAPLVRDGYIEPVDSFEWRMGAQLFDDIGEFRGAELAGDLTGPDHYDPRKYA